MVEQNVFPQLIRLTGFLALLGVAAAALWSAQHAPWRFQGLDALLWVGSMLAFLLLYTVATSPGGRAPSRGAQLWMCAGEAALALYANGLIGGHGLHSGLLVIVAVQVINLVTLPAALAWVGVQTAVYYLTLRLNWAHWTTVDALSNGISALFYQVFALLSAGAAMREAQARAELSRANTELHAARALLEHQSRLAERLRISRDLHDVLGHHLTALNMNLEVAAYDLGSERAPQHVERARQSAGRLLGDVREVVSAMRAADTADVRCGLRALVTNIPHLRVHLNIAPDLAVPDVNRAEVILRCAGEIITNAARHAQAQNLWLDVVRTPAGLEVRARDDGRGVPELRLGSGLRGMRERLEEVGGRLTLASEPERGFHVRAFVPLTAEVA